MLLPLQLETQRPRVQVCPERVQSLFDSHLARSSVGFKLHAPAPSQVPAPLLQDVPDVKGSVPQVPLRQTLRLHSAGVPVQSEPDVHSAVQSLSSRLSVPGGQQPSLLTFDVTVTGIQLTLHELAEPTSFSWVQPRAAAQLVRQLPSHVSSPVVAPSPQRVSQSSSLPAFAPLGQQPSPRLGEVTGEFSHFTLHCTGVPSGVSVVQGSLSSQFIMQSAPSQVSLASLTPLPQVGEQSESVVEFAPIGQQSSPAAATVICVDTHSASHVAAPPMSMDALHSFCGGQVLGQSPSHFSAPSLIPLPQLGPLVGRPADPAPAESALLEPPALLDPGAPAPPVDAPGLLAVPAGGVAMLTGPAPPVAMLADVALEPPVVVALADVLAAAPPPLFSEELGSVAVAVSFGSPTDASFSTSRQRPSTFVRPVGQVESQAASNMNAKDKSKVRPK